MNNNTVLGLTGLVLLCVCVLLYINFSKYIQPEKPVQSVKTEETENYLSYNDVSSIAIIHNDKPYLLNFEQQNSLIGILNTAQPINKSKSSSEKMTFDFKKIVIYPFNAPVIEITPFAYVNNNLVFSAPLWNKTVLMQENSQGALKKLLSETFDH